MSSPSSRNVVTLKFASAKRECSSKNVFCDSDSEDERPYSNFVGHTQPKTHQLTPIDWQELEQRKDEVVALVNVERLDDALSVLGKVLLRLSDTRSEDVSSIGSQPRIELESAKTIEMQAQIKMMQGEYVVAAKLAQRAHSMAPCWPIALQTFGRALYNLGEVKMAKRAFSRAIHLDPVNEELWMEDLNSCRQLLERPERMVVDEELPEKQDSESLDAEDGDSGSTHKLASNHVMMRS